MTNQDYVEFGKASLREWREGNKTGAALASDFQHVLQGVEDNEKSN